MFRRRRGSDDEEVPGEEFSGEESEDISGDEPETAPSPVRPTGPWDIADLPEDGIGRVDIGGLQIPIVDGCEIRLDVDSDSGQLMSVTIATESSAMQMMAFAAPKTAGIWDDVRAEIEASITGGGGRAQTVQEQFGIELVADVPTDTPGQLMPARFLGVDGPRWFLRALLQGQAATTPSVDPVLRQVFSLTAVVRGEDAMAVRDPLPLHIPADAQMAEPPPDEDAVAEPDLSLPERGPEITETR